jgi:hypothetical protein
LATFPLSNAGFTPEKRTNLNEMTKKAIFAGLVVDENDNIVETTYVGSEPVYIVDDDGFRRHIPAEQVDRQVLEMLQETIKGQENLLSEQAAKMLGQDDIFTRAMLESQFKQMDKQFDRILEIGIPEDALAYMGMTGFRIRINLHGDVVELRQPGMIDPRDE